jgi:hypothetical protein
MPHQPIEFNEQHAPVITYNTDALLAKMKDMLKVGGHDVELVFDDVAALAKKGGESNTGRRSKMVDIILS